MTLVKLGSGAEIVVDHVDAFQAASDSTKEHPKRVVVVNGVSYRITHADHARIVEAMNPQKTSREFLVKEMLIKAQAIADLSAILNYTDGGIDVAKALRGISDDLSRVANA